MSSNKFDFREIVFISSSKKSLISFNGRVGVVRGISESDVDPNQFAYSVDILNKDSEVEVCKFIFEEDLCATGKKMNKADMYTGESIRVRVDPETGKGEIIEDDEE